MNWSSKILNNIFVASFIIMIASCNDSLFNSGNIITKKIEISDFEEIYINSIFDVYLYQDTICKISVTGGSNLIPNLTFEVDQDKKLMVDDLNTANWSRDYDKIELHISVDTLRFLQLNSPCNLVCIDSLITPEIKIYTLNEYSDIQLKVKCNTCYIANSETSGGNVNIEGTTDYYRIFARGTLRINSRNLNANHVNVKTESIGDCYINANKDINAEILRSGNVYYIGNPDTIIYENEKAKYQLIKID